MDTLRGALSVTQIAMYLLRLGSRPNVQTNNKSKRTTSSFDKSYHPANIRLGEGGGCVGVEVYIRQTDGTPVAVKVVAHDKLDALQCMHHTRELHILRNLPKHTNLVQLEAIYNVPNYTYIVMPYDPHAEELFDTIDRVHHKKNNVPAHERNKTDHNYDPDDIMRQLLSVVAHLHTHRIAHRDIKAENVLCNAQTQHQHVTLLDVGLAAHGNQLDRCTTMVGTREYIAPEMVDRMYKGSGSYDARLCDAWSLGVLLYIMCTGSPPFYDTTPRKLHRKICRGAYSHDLLRNKDASHTSLQCLERLLRANPRQRVRVGDVLKDVYG